MVALVDRPRAPVFALASGLRIGRVKHVRGVTDAAFGPSGRFVASGGRDRIGRIWAVRTWEEAGRLVGHAGQVLAVDLDGSGKRVATASTDQTARAGRRSTGRVVSSTQSAKGQVGDVAFGPAGRSLGKVTAQRYAASRRERAYVRRGHRGAGAEC